MDHVDLKPYPFPEGVAIPRLMPFQEYPWNGDGYLAAEVLRLKAAHGLISALETGMCLGSTTCWLAENFQGVMTCETNAQYYKIGMARCGGLKGVAIFNHDSRKVTAMRYIGMPNDRTLYWLDAHWGPSCPLLDELANIANLDIKPCIVIHDFQVPGTDFGFDRFPDSGYPFSLEAIAPHLDKIYGEGGWKHNYPTQVEGAKRGWISIEPDVHH